jgi:hypothetical protein
MGRWASFAVFNSERRWLVDQSTQQASSWRSGDGKTFVQELGMANDDGGALTFC